MTTTPANRPRRQSRSSASQKPRELARVFTDPGFRVLGGPSSPTDRDAPDVELTFSADPVQVFVAFYRDSARAARFEPEVRRNAERFEGVVERRASVIIVWSAPPSPDSREAVRRYAFAT